MEELREKFAKQVAYIDKMSANITINSNNFEILKTLKLSENQIVLMLENMFADNEYIKQHDKIAKKFEEVKNDKVEFNNLTTSRRK